MKRSLAIILTIVMCLSLTPMAALADDAPYAENTALEVTEAENFAEEESAPLEEPAYMDEAPAEEESSVEEEVPAETSSLSAAEPAEEEEPYAAEDVDEEALGEDDPAEEEEESPDMDGEALELEYDSKICVNPLYADLYEAGILQIQVPDLTALELDGASENEFSSVADASAYVRGQLKTRNEEIVLTYIFPDGTDYDARGAIIEEIWSSALMHTGEPNEGDYLSYQYGSYRWGYSGYGNTFTVTYTVAYYTTAEQEEEMDTAVANAMAELALDGKTNYEKVKAIHDYILKHVTYVNDNLDDSSYLLKYTAYAALINGTSVCQGYAVLTYRMMLMAGIDCRVISGIADNGTDRGGHAWNIVQLGGKYYYLDTTWDDGARSDDYFLKCSFDDHWADEEEFPASFFEAYPIADTDYDPEQEEPETVVIPTGPCGDELTWTLDDGVLTISGTGAMWDFQETDTPWADYVDEIGEIVIESGATSIGNSAFAGCEFVEAITIPNSVTSIGNSAFVGCMGLMSISIPAGVTSIGIEAFSGCGSLTGVDLPESLTEIGDYAFSECESLESISIPNGVTSIGSYAFDGCSNLTSVSLSDSVTGIGEWAFSGCSSLVSITIPSRVTVIANSTFTNCTSLTAVTIPANVESIEDHAFYGCSALNQIVIPASVTSIGAHGFGGCSALTSITFAGDAPTFGANVFADVTATAYYPSGNETWTEDARQNYGGEITWVAVVPTLEMTFSHSCSFDNNLTINYYVPAAMLEGYSNFRLMLEKQTFAKGGSSSYTWVEYEITDYVTRSNGGKQYNVFSFSNIAAKEMGDEIHAVLYAEKDGIVYESLEDVYSVKTYAYSRLDKSTDDNFKRLMADLLNYGAAAQVNFTYNTGNLVNAEMTDVHKTYVSEMPELSSVENLIETDGATAHFYGKTIVLNSSVEMKYYMTFDSGEPSDTVKLMLTYTAIDGTEYTETIPSSEFEYRSDYGAYGAKLTSIAAKDMCCKVTARIYDGDMLIGDVLEYSIETYAYNRLLKSTDENFKELVREMMKYGKSADYYFRNKQ